MTNGSDEFRYVSAGQLEGGSRSEPLLQSLREPLDRHDRLDLLARATALVAGLAALAALPLRFYTAQFGSGAPLGIHVTGWGTVTTFGDGFATGYHAPLHGYAFAGAAVIVVLTAWTIPRCATLGLGVLVGCASVLVADLLHLGAQPEAHVSMGPFLPVVGGAVMLALLLRLATVVRRPPGSTPAD